MPLTKAQLIKCAGGPVVLAILAFALFNGIFFYNEAGFSTHVRTIFGEEKAVDDAGYATKWFGRAKAWPWT